jgi:hypothetical protein
VPLTVEEAERVVNAPVDGLDEPIDILVIDPAVLGAMDTLPADGAMDTAVPVPAGAMVTVPPVPVGLNWIVCPDAVALTLPLSVVVCPVVPSVVVPAGEMATVPVPVGLKVIAALDAIASRLPVTLYVSVPGLADRNCPVLPPVLSKPTTSILAII